MTYNRIKSAVDGEVTNPLTDLSNVLATLENAKEQLSTIEMEDKIGRASCRERV